jgi:hypothetical protein
MCTSLIPNRTQITQHMQTFIYALQHSVTVTDPVFTKTQASCASFWELLHRISRDFDRGVVADTRSKQTDGWTWSPHKDLFFFFHKERPKQVQFEMCLCLFQAICVISKVSLLTQNPKVFYYSSRSAPFTIFHLLVQIALHLGPTAGCPWMTIPASNATGSWPICENGVWWVVISWPHYLVTVGAGAYEASWKDGKH